jgi:prevent-host-death family protein
MKVTASKLRENIYTILDEALETGVPVEVVRKGRVLRIVPEQRVSKLSRLKKRNCLNGDPETIVSMDWLHEWSESK